MTSDSAPTVGDIEKHELFAAVYDDLRRRAKAINAHGRLEFSTTTIVHEAYLKLAGARVAPVDRQHFFAIAARAMRQVVLNAIRDAGAIKRGGDRVAVTLDEGLADERA